jgi:beta-lysine N6-acetyltransferase
MITSFTIARGLSYGMNIALAKKGYEFYGTLVHNTNFSGRIESMNVWSRPV